MQCEMCGSEKILVRALIEETELDVCEGCARFGKILKRPEIKHIRESKAAKTKEPEKEIIQLIVGNYSQIIKQKREQLGLMQKELANKLAEKESVIHSIESGRYEPDLNLAKKLERFLGIKLIEEYEEVKEKSKERETEGLTIGDLIKTKESKKNI